MNAFQKVRRFIERHALLDGARGVVVAVSGGPDSVALLDMLARLPCTIHVAHLNHKLRGAESDTDAEFVRRLGERLGLAVTIAEADVRAAARGAHRGIEETARALRYDFLLRVARTTGADRIATGHTMNDQAETFLMRLARGAGTRGLAAMRPVRDAATRRRGDAETSHGFEQPLVVSLIRPLLCITRDEVEAYCNKCELNYRIDATNFADKFTRNRVRRDVLPALQAINPQAVEAIARAAEHLAADEDALDVLAKRSLDAARIESADDAAAAYHVAAFKASPAGLRQRMLIEAAARARGGEAITAKHIAAVQTLLDEKMSGKRVELPGGLEAWREFDALVFKRQAQAVDDYTFELSAGRPEVEAGGVRLLIERGVPASRLSSLIEQAARLKTERRRDWLMAVLDDQALPACLLVRPRRRGARVRLAGRDKTIKLKKLMIDHTIPVSRRAAWPVVMTTDNRYVWSPGLPPAVDFAAHDETRFLAIVRASEPLELCRSTDG